MNYRLVILTHGDPRKTLPLAAEAFHAHAIPEPMDVVIVRDGPASDVLGGVVAEMPWQSPPRCLTGHAEGFCAATARAWREGSRGDADYVFYLEHDFVLTRDVDLAKLAYVLDSDRDLSQMALVRNAVNPHEIAAGGLVKSRPGAYALIQTSVPAPEGFTLGVSWLSHLDYFTTNPSLMRCAFMAENPWPSYSSECEGRFGIDLLERGYYFGAWGMGETWCRHIGVRDGFGY
jgi:hypothetical protein